VTSWEPPADLMRLLDALSAEIIGSTDGDVLVSNADQPSSSRQTLTGLARMCEMIETAIDEPDEANDSLLFVELAVSSELRHRPN